MDDNLENNRKINMNLSHYLQASLLSIATLLFSCQLQPKQESNMSNPRVTLYTNLGEIQIELFEKQAPITVKNFLRYIDESHYTHTIFHRVIDGFMIQGGGMTAELKMKAVHEPIRNEADNRLSNSRGTVAMARTSEVHSATSQFYINVADNSFLDYRNPTPSGFGYCVFGKVISGMDIVDKIKSTETATENGHDDVPIKAIEILEIVRH
jgi:peptidyl-prolyl cis-trans isomerase B (cyclophilin B)